MKLFSYKLRSLFPQYCQGIATLIKIRSSPVIAVKFPKLCSLCIRMLECSNYNYNRTMNAADELKYWISFSRIPGIGKVKVSQLLGYFNSLGDAWQAAPGELKKSGLDSKSVSLITSLRQRLSPDDELDKLNKYRAKAIPYNSPDYPQRLKEIHDFPVLIYVRGNLLPEDDCCLAVVGTRRATTYGRQVAEEIVTDLAKNKITIISGLAKGIDTIAHHAALAAQGRTIAVFGCGLDIVYPSENARLAREIMEQGALISEYPLGTRPKADNFPRRNRIMSGMSLGVLVVEAGDRSGALITTEQALQQNREVFAIPGNIFSPASKGTNNLIQQGAKLVKNYVDVLEELNLAFVAQQLEMREVIPTDAGEALLLKQLSFQPNHIDEICRHSGMPAAIVSSKLTMMELKGMVKQIGNMNYVLAKECREEYQSKV